MSLTEIKLKEAIAPVPPLVPPETPVTKVIALMSAIRTNCSLSAEESAKPATSCVLVVKENHLLGIFTERDVVKLSAQGRSLAEIAIAEVMTQPVITLHRSEFTDIFTVLNLLQVHNLHHLPLLDEGDRPVGILTQKSLRQLLHPLDLLRLRLVSEVMSSQVIWTEPNTPMLKVAQLMVEHQVSCVIIGAIEAKATIIPVGIVTESDIVQFQALGLDFTQIDAGTVMSTPPFVVSPDDSLWKVQELMERQQIRRVVVRGNRGELLGVVTQTNLLQSFNPLDLYKSLESLETKVSRLETEKRTWLETRNLELEQEVETRTIQLQAQVKREQLLGAIANQIRSSLDWQEIADITVREVRSLLKCNAVVIWQFQPDGSTLAVAEAKVSNQPSYLARQVKDACFTANGLMDYGNEQIRVVPDIYTTEMSDCHREFLEQLQIRAKILVPIQQGETLWGMLSAIETQAPRQWQTDEMELLKRLATQLAIALQQAAVLKQVETELAEKKRVEAALQWQIEFDRLIAHISNRFMQLSFSELNHGIDHALQHMGEFLQVDTSYIFQYSDDRQTFSMTHEWIAEGLPAQIDNCQNLPCAAFPWSSAKICHGENISVSSLDRLSPEADLDRQAWQNFGLTSVLSIPLRDRQRVIGFVGFASLHSEQIWSENMIQILQIFSEILTHVIQRQQAEMELESSERRYASLAEAAPAGIFRTDVQGHCLYVNNCWSQMTGLPASASLGTGWATFIHPDDHHRVVGEWQRLISKNTSFQQEFRVQHSEGEIYWVLSQAIPEHDARGQVIGYVGTVTDISDRKRRELEQQIVENTLLKSERRYRHLIQAQTDLIMRSLPDTTITFANDALCLALGRSLEEVIGWKWSNFVPPEDLDELNRKITALSPENPTFENINQDYRANNQIGWTQWINLGIFGDRGELVEIQSVGRDITSLQRRIKREQALNRVFQSIRNSLDLDTIFATATAETAQLLKTLDCFVVQYLPEQGVWRHIAEFRHHRDTPTVIGLEIPDAGNPFAAQLKRFEIVRVEDTNNLNDQINQEVAQTIPGAWLLIPLVVEGSLWGSFTITASEQPFIWENEQVEIAQSVAHQLEIAIQQANLYQQVQLELAERYRVEMALRESQDRLKEAQRIARIGSWELTLSTNTLLWSDEIYRIFEIDPQKFRVTYEGFLEAIHPDDRDMVNKADTDSLKNRIPYTIVHRLLMADGRVKYVQQQCQTFYDKQGQPLRSMGTIQDITEQKRTEQALKDKENRLSNLIANLPGYVYRVANDPNYTPEFISEGVYKITGYRQEEYLVDRTISCGQEIHPDDAEAIWNLVQQALENKQAYECEYRIITKTGETKWVWERGRGCWTQSGELLHLEGFVTDISDRKAAQLELNYQKELLQTTFDHLPVMVGVYSAKGEVLMINRELERVIGWNRAEYATVDVLRACYPNPADYEQVLTHIITADSTWKDFQTLTRDGRLLDTSWAQIRLSDGRSIGIGQDITDRKQAEVTRLQAEKLKLELTLLEKILNIVLAGYWDWDIPNHIAYMSPGLKRMFGYEDAELPNVPETWQRLIFPEDLPKTLECFDQHVQSHGEIPYYNEVRYRHKNGSTVWVMCSGQVIEWDKQGNPLRMIGCHIDISERKQAESAIQESEARFRYLADSAPVLIWMSGLDKLCFHFNKGWLEFTGRSLDQEFGNGWLEGVHPDDVQFCSDTYTKSFDLRQKFEMEYRLRRFDGEYRWLLDTGIPRFDANGEFVGYIGSCIDISDRKETEEQLQQKTQQLEATNRELESFSYSVSHDLRAPLRHINGFVNALGQQLQQHSVLDDPKVVRYLEVIEGSSQKMAQLIDGLLTLSRMTRRQIEYKPVNIKQLVEEAIFFIQSNPGESTPVEFVLGHLPTVNGDETLLQQVFSNLIDNAVKFSRNHPTPLVEISSLPDRTIFIKDNGVGFSMEYADKLFGAFQRLHSQKEFEGTGIGLAIVQRIIHRHGGTIWVESQLGQGTTFYFKI
jgi:PAS domain S-box-containing protein